MISILEVMGPFIETIVDDLYNLIIQKNFVNVKNNGENLQTEQKIENEEESESSDLEQCDEKSKNLRKLRVIFLLLMKII